MNPGLGEKIGDLKFRFGTRNLVPRTFWHCDEECQSPCKHVSGQEVIASEDGTHIELVLEHAQ